MKDSRIPTILGIALLLVGIVDGVIFVKNQQIFSVNASYQSRPKNVRVSNINEDSFTVSWTTDKKTSGYVRWGDSESLNRIASDSTQKPSYVHSINVQSLESNKTVFFKIISAGSEFDNNGINWQIKTGKKIPLKPASYVISGRIVTADGQPAEGSVVYVVVGGSSPLSTMTEKNGIWAMTISNARTITLDNYVSIDETKTPVEISVQSGPSGVAFAYIYPVSARPAPAIVLGKTHNFKNSQPQDFGEVPEARIELP